MKEARFDRQLLAVTLISLSIGLVAIYSASFIFAMTRQKDPNYFLFRQIFFVAIGIVFLILLIKIPLSFLEKGKVVLAIYSFQMFLLLIVFIFPRINGAHRWIKIGSFTLQPSEFAKITAIIVTSYLLKKKMEKKVDWVKLLAQFTLSIGSMAILIFAEPDLGMTFIIVVISLSLIFVNGLPFKYIVPIGGIAGVLLLIGILVAPYRMERLIKNPENDPQRSGFQIRQSLIAVGSGGIIGKKLGDGSSKRLFLPLPHTDFIFANIAEELGLVGSILLMLLILYFGYKGFKIAIKVENPYYSLIAYGITFWIVLQALIHIGVNIYILPPKGMPLPFISYGGSSLLSTLFGVGILLNISKEL